jgi:hypothetical protein
VVAVGFGSIETMIDRRDERMRTMLFDLPSHLYARASTRVDIRALGTTPIGGTVEIVASLLIEADGRCIETEATLIVERLGPDRPALSTVAPSLIDAHALGFGQRIEALREIA